MENQTMNHKCPHMENCAMLQRLQAEPVKNIFTSVYCEGDFENCHRKKRLDQGKSVPNRLLPNGRLLAL